MTKRKTQEDFEAEANKIHKGIYNYKYVVYVSNKIKVKIICRNNHEFEQTPYAHVGLKQGCPLCAGLAKSTTKEFVEKARKIHGERYDYSLVIYINARTKVKIICPKHGIFEQTARNHINSKQGCTECGKEINGWSKTKFIDLCYKNNNGKGLFYIIRCYNEYEIFYKIGITSKSIAERYQRSGSMPYTYEVIQEVHLQAADAYTLEKIFKTTLKPYQYIPQKKFDGFTECFLST